MEIDIPRIQRHSERVSRRSVSLTLSLNERMRRFEDVNWSAIASQAFEQVVQQLEKQIE